MHVGYWGLAVIVIVLISWWFYRYLTPSSWKDWTRAGLVQAFIIAFYAEMYGFPLTIYLLARFFGLDVAWTTGGNLWAQLFGTPVAHLIAMVIGYGFVFVGVSMIAEGWREIYRGKQENRLVTDGLYGVVRHPQYTGLFVALFGEGIIHWPTIISVVMFPIIVGAYVKLAKKEEKQMLDQFGERYRAYLRSVPMFVPDLKKLSQVLGQREPGGQV